MWTATEMNGIGQKTLSVKVNSTSMNDNSLVAAYDQRMLADLRWGRWGQVCLARTAHLPFGLSH